MRVLITGAAGFLGSHLTDAVLAEGHEVLGVDNLCTGSLSNLEHPNHESRFEFSQHDICLPFDPRRVDFVFNFASPASPADYMRLGIETLMVGSIGTRNVLDLAIAVRYGERVDEVAREVQRRVVAEVRESTGLQDVTVNVTVDDIVD